MTNYDITKYFGSLDLTVTKSDWTNFRITKNRLSKGTVVHDWSAGWEGINQSATHLKFGKQRHYETCVSLPWWYPAVYAERFETWLRATLGEGGRNKRYKWRKNQLRPSNYYIRGADNLALVKLRWEGISFAE